ncbi:MAG: hypothetical protein IT438_03505 [Phycisphaerales bacterium]|nr:hypothetical protein [Phycisphaerales bacterium]
MTRYDPAVLQKFANRLYSRANTIIALCTLVGLALGAVGGFVLESSIKTGSSAGVAGACAFVTAAVGYLVGAQRAFMLKFRAQEALCQRQIELNTRQGGSVAG